jgi:hypothetical protein
MIEMIMDRPGASIIVETVTIRLFGRLSEPVGRPAGTASSAPIRPEGHNFGKYFTQSG